MSIYVPATIVKKGQLIVVDDNRNTLYEGDIALPGEASILRINLPASVTFSPNRVYTWQFSINCQVATDYVESRIKRVVSNLAQLNPIEGGKTPLEQAQAYADQFLWQDTVMVMAARFQTQREEWRELLGSIGLEDLKDYPVQTIDAK